MYMKNNEEIYGIRKLIVVCVHLASLLYVIYGFMLIYVNGNLRKGFWDLNNEIYEDSSRFKADLEQDIEYIFDYERYKYIFERDDKFNKETEVFSIYESPEKEKVYTLEDILSYAKKSGFYIDEDYQVTKLYEEEENSEKAKYLVTWLRYTPQENIKEPGDAYMSLDELSEEVLLRLAKYYKAYKNLKLSPRNIYYDLDYPEYAVSNTVDLDTETVKKYGKYIIITSDSMQPDSNINTVPENLYEQASIGIYDPLSDNGNTSGEDYVITIGVDTQYPNYDVYYNSKMEYNKRRDEYFSGMVLIMMGSLMGTVSFLLMMVMSGKVSDKNDKVRIVFFADRYSVELRALILLIAIIILWFISERVVYKFIHVILPDYMWKIGERINIYLIVYLSTLLYIFSVVRSFKAGLLWKNSFIRHIKEEGSIYRGSYTFTRRFTSNYVLYYFINIIGIFAIMFMVNSESTLFDRLIIVLMIFLLSMLNVFAFFNMYNRSVAIDKISDAIEEISEGITDNALDESKFSGKEKLLAQRVNNIGNGLSSAITEQVKSERLKADLITNVSHDIRTPITSIINYIDLIKREHPENENIKKYLEVLETKSLHLKKLTEDLIEASKASSGNLSVNLEEIDFAQMIKQTNGEFEEKYSTRGLTIISSLPTESIKIKADGGHLWRVLENIYSNAYKYALENSRIYVSLEAHDNKAVFVMKNVSSNQLNVSPAELTMRFVRGDSSRTTEGSGLGLSIVKSLAKLQKGKFEVEIDGDLFKVKLMFDLLK